jgi:predicted N-acetyltransferase YhbS
MNIQFKPLTESNFDQIVPILARVFPKESNEAEQELNAFLNGEPSQDDGGQTFLTDQWITFDESNKAVGTIGLYRYEFCDDNEYWLSWFGVDQKLQGQGIGSKLMNFVLEELEKRKAISLSLWTKPHHRPGMSNNQTLLCV